MMLGPLLHLLRRGMVFLEWAFCTIQGVEEGGQEDSPLVKKPTIKTPKRLPSIVKTLPDLLLKIYLYFTQFDCIHTDG